MTYMRIALKRPTVSMVSTMIDKFFSFVSAILPELIKLYNSIQSDEELTEDEEVQLAMSIIRKAKNKQAREEIEG